MARSMGRSLDPGAAKDRDAAKAKLPMRIFRTPRPPGRRTRSPGGEVRASQDSRCTRPVTRTCRPDVRWSGDPLPAQLAHLPPGDGAVPADDLDFAQPVPVTVHRLLSLDHPARGRRLRNLALGAGLLDEDEIGRPRRDGTVDITRIDHTCYDIRAGSGCSHRRYGMRHTEDSPARFRRIWRVSSAGPLRWAKTWVGGLQGSIEGSGEPAIGRRDVGAGGSRAGQPTEV